MPIIIRTPELTEMAHVGRLAGDLVRLHHRLDPDRFMLHEPIDEGYARFLTSMLEDRAAVVLVAVVEEAVAGYSYGRLESRDWNRLLDRHGKLHDIYVDETARRRGLAKQLAEETFRRLRELGAKRIVLDAAFGNQAARAFFASLGFRSTMVELMRTEA